MSVFREAERDDLDLDARESDAVRAFGHWRARLQTRVLLAFGLVGVVLAALGYWAAQELQLRHTEWVSLRVNVLGAALPWGAMFALGALIARMLVRRRTPAKLDELASRFEVPRERLQEIADLVRAL